jgi:hypothetical protein
MSQPLDVMGRSRLEMALDGSKKTNSASEAYGGGIYN